MILCVLTLVQRRCGYPSQYMSKLIYEMRIRVDDLENLNNLDYYRQNIKNLVPTKSAPSTIALTLLLS